MYSAALADVKAFAKTRDNATLLSSPTLDFTKERNPDPVKRVMLYGFADSRTLFVRGAEADVQQVRRMVERFDQPQTQTVMTLWTTELSSDGTKQGADKTMRAIGIVQDEMSIARTQMDASLDLLKSCIAKQVNQSVAAARAAGGASLTAYTDDDIARFAFFDDDALKELGISSQPYNNRASVTMQNALLPRPSGTSTLAEALLVLCLAKSVYRDSVLKDFQATVKSYINKETADSLNSRAKSVNEKLNYSPGPAPVFDVANGNAFPNLTRFFTAKAGGSLPAAGAENMKRELVWNLQRHAAPYMVDYAKSILNQIAVTERRIPAATTQYQAVVAQIGKLPGGQAYLTNSAGNATFAAENPALVSQYQQLITEITALPAQIVNLNNDYDNAVLGYFKRRYGEDSTNSGFVIRNRIWNTSAEQLKEELSGLADTEIASSNSRVAATNEVFKKYVMAIEDDMQRQFVEPMFQLLRARLVHEAGVNVGVIQRTSILGSNRLAARVDASASAELALGQTRNDLQDVISLLNVVQAGIGLPAGGSTSALTGDLLKAATTAAAPAAGANKTLDTAHRVMTTLDRLPSEAPPAIYGITTGNTFQVTPVADPSGQALRFRFDHVLSTPIREPNGTTDPQLNRIERHGVNTEVQLSNNEIRLISQFDSNAQLGLPSRRSGGIPVLRDLPILKEIPIVGWFVRRGGRAAVVQQSMILGQTTMFPTINNIIDLLTVPFTLPTAPKDKDEN
jgi:hypothetical protein